MICSPKNEVDICAWIWILSKINIKREKSCRTVCSYDVICAMETWIPHFITSKVFLILISLRSSLAFFEMILSSRDSCVVICILWICSTKLAESVLATWKKIQDTSRSLKHRKKIFWGKTKSSMMESGYDSEKLDSE